MTPFLCGSDTGKGPSWSENVIQRMRDRRGSRLGGVGWTERLDPPEMSADQPLEGKVPFGELGCCPVQPELFHHQIIGPAAHGAADAPDVFTEDTENDQLQPDEEKQAGQQERQRQWFRV